MSEPKLISPMLDNFAMGDPFSERSGVRCCPAMEKDTEDKYVVKIISIPSTQSKLEALLLSGAYSDKEAALSYFNELANDIIEETQILQKLSALEGFVAYEKTQIVPMEDEETGYDVYLLSTYRNTLQQFFRCNPMTHLGVLNLALDLCTALSACRRSGYLYVDLKPDNIYLTGENTYRIGDIGFLKLDSLKYASLPDRYRSQYTAPEIQDAYSALNATVDIYALGLILYQAFNDGALPFRSDDAPQEAFPPPAYADYEMAEIILKACSPDPEERWQDPAEMGQALVGYMQRNGAHDTPIIPAPLPDSSEEEIIEEETAEEAELQEAIPSDENSEIAPEDVVPENSDEELSAEESVLYTEDTDGNLSFLSDSAFDEAELEAEAETIDYEEVTEEVSEILVQADELIAHPAPDPVIPPEPIDVPIPDPLPLEEEETEETEETTDEDENAAKSEETSEDAETSDQEATEEPVTEDEEESAEDEEEIAPPKRSHWLRNTLLALMAVALLAVGFLYYKNFYLQPIESIVLEDLESGNLTVYVTSQADEKKLSVICSDTYGNQLTAPVENGKAVFTNLAPNSAYNVRIKINGFHKLTGDVTTAFTTPAQTNIVQFNAVTGSEDGSAILGFTIDGPDSETWSIRYSTDGEEEKEVTFSGHMTTLTGLTIDKKYTFTLQPVDDILTTGTNQIEHTASNIIKAEDLMITGCVGDVLTVTWSAPEGIPVESWTVRCYSETGYDQTTVCTDTNAAFEGVDLATGYTVEVTAAGMSVNQRTFAEANAITVQLTVNDSDPDKIKLSWDSVDAEPTGSWLLQYSINGSAPQDVKTSEDNVATLPTRIPGVRYTFTLQLSDGIPVLGGTVYYDTEAAKPFEGYGVTADSMEFKMCKTPKTKNWDRYDLKKSDYTTSFVSGKKASFLVHLKQSYSKSSDNITTLFVIRDANGAVVSSASVSKTWKSMWSRNYCELDIPAIPKTVGEYTISVYFNGALVNEQAFTVTD